MARSQADIANMALRIFLQHMGAAYDEARGYKRYDAKGFAEVREFFNGCCCYCGVPQLSKQFAQDHLIPMNKAELGLHAWGNVVPACLDCNSKKQGKEWHAYLASCEGSFAAERYLLITDFIAKYKYAPDTNNLISIAGDLYEEVGAIAVALIDAKVNRLRKSI